MLRLDLGTVPIVRYLLFFLVLFMCVEYFCRTFGTYGILASRYLVLIYNYNTDMVVACIGVVCSCFSMSKCQVVYLHLSRCLIQIYIKVLADTVLTYEDDISQMNFISSTNQPDLSSHSPQYSIPSGKYLFTQTQSFVINQNIDFDNDQMWQKTEHHLNQT